ncbi:hypothetical protein VmeM32_00074 [Vibrio phage vB_VmeM-32]|nr:hypothetical protein VmeM32_00074 [Vibrio phage vB_VmeM-32]
MIKTGMSKSMFSALKENIVSYSESHYIFNANNPEILKFTCFGAIRPNEKHASLVLSHQPNALKMVETGDVSLCQPDSNATTLSFADVESVDKLIEMLNGVRQKIINSEIESYS